MIDKKDEALKLALKKAFDLGQRWWQLADSEYSSHWKKADAVKERFNQLVEDTIRKALAEQPAQQQEPVAWMTEEATNGVNVWLFKKTALKYSNNPTPLYTAPPNVPTARASKPWVGLTDEERDDIWERHHTTLGGWDYGGDDVMYDRHFEPAVADIEAKLREKNQ